MVSIHKSILSVVSLFSNAVALRHSPMDHTGPKKIISDLIQSIPHVFPLDEGSSRKESKPLTIQKSGKLGMA